MPGLEVYRFSSGLYYANANRFNEEILGLVDGADPKIPVRCVVLEASGSRRHRLLGADAQRSSASCTTGVRGWSSPRSGTLRAELDRFDLTETFGPDAFDDSVRDAVEAFVATGTAFSGPDPTRADTPPPEPATT